MVLSASSSNTQWPSACRRPSNACVADAMLASIALLPPAAMLRSTATLPSLPNGWLPDFISFDIASRSLWVNIPKTGAACSGLAHGQDEVCSAVAGSYRALDGGGQSRISPVAREKQIFPGRDRARPQCVLFRRGLERRPALAHDLPGRQIALNTRDLADIPPKRLRELIAGHVHEPVAIADGDRKPLRKRKQPLHQSTHYTDERRHIARRIEPEMRVDDRPEFRRSLQARQQHSGRTRRTRHHDAVSRFDGHDVIAESQFADAVTRHGEAAQLVPEINPGPLRAQHLDGRIDQNG